MGIIFLIIIGLLALGIAHLFNKGYLGVNVPLLKAWVMLDAFTSDRYVLFEGWHLKWPWQLPEIEVDLQREDIVTSGKGTELAPEQHVEQYTTSDGVLLEATWILTFRANGESEETIIRYVENEPEIIKPVLASAVRNCLSTLFANNTAEWITKHKDDFNEKLKILFRENEKCDLEDAYGLKDVNAQLSNVQFDKETQKQRAQKAGVDYLMQNMTALTGDGMLTPKDARDTVLLMNGQLTQNIEDIRFDGDLNVKGLENLQHLSGGSLAEALVRGKKGKGGQK